MRILLCGSIAIGGIQPMVANEVSAADDDTKSNQSQTAIDKPSSKLYPSLPGALHDLPDWLKRDVPFDVDRYLAPVPEDENSARQYLTALYEFSPYTVRKCMSPADHEERGPLLTEREKRTEAMYWKWDREKSDVTLDERGKLVSEYQSAFKKLSLAQTGRCVFESAVELGDILDEPFLACRWVVRLLDWRVEGHISAGRLDAACNDVELALRMNRDIRSRGTIIRQLHSMALDGMTLGNMVPRILAAAGPRT